MNHVLAFLFNQQWNALQIFILVSRDAYLEFVAQ